MQKYVMKSDVRSCKRWSELRELLLRAVAKKIVSGTSADKLYRALQNGGRDDTAQFDTIKRRFLDALNGKAIKV